MAADGKLSLMVALNRYVANVKSGVPPEGHQELNRFIQWCGRDRTVDKLTPSEIADFAESAGVWWNDSARKLNTVKSFLSYLKKAGLVEVNLAPHLKSSKSKKSSKRVYMRSGEQAELTAEGHANLQTRLEILKQDRIKVVADIQRAMADKDFRENAPLDAAKERQGFIESGIRELEGILANAVVRTNKTTDDTKRVKLGRKVTLKDPKSGKQVYYRVVDSREADPVTGKISNVSPVGKALLDKVIGEEVQVTVPKGTLHYIVQKIER